jgi:hypothetical protein
MGWTGHVAGMGDMRDACKVLSENLKGEQLEELGVDGSYCYMLGGCGLNSSGSRLAAGSGSCEHCDEHLCSITGGEFLSKCYIL